jgi:hypothetical protein
MFTGIYKGAAHFVAAQRFAVTNCANRCGSRARHSSDGGYVNSGYSDGGFFNSLKIPECLKLANL